MYTCRYRITSDLGQGHLVLGKLVFSSNGLTDLEATAIQNTFPTANLNRCIIYNRALINGTLYASTSYKRSTSKCDYLLCVVNNAGISKTVGSAIKYVSFCLDACSCSKYCQHIVIVKVHTSNSTARYIHCYNTSDSR